MGDYLIDHTDENKRLDFQNQIDVYNLDKELAHFSWNKDKLILDAGCGSGNVIEKLIHLGMRSIHGLDFSETRINQAKEKFHSYKDLTFYQGSLEKTALPDNTYDIILCRYVFEHLTHPEDVIKELYRILRPGGTFYIINFNNIFFDFYTKNESFNQKLKMLKEKLPQDFEIAVKLPQLLKKHGFKKVDWDAETFFFKGERLQLEQENNRMRLHQGRAHLMNYFDTEEEYNQFAQTYIDEMSDDCNVMSVTKYLIKASKT